jgi:hypothetical protein
MMKELYEQANAYRLHQDTLKWNLFAGYVAFFVGVAGFHEHLQTLPAVCGILVVIVANLFLLLLAVESWFYKLHSEYVTYCEQFLLYPSAAGPPLTSKQYSAQHRHSITPNHPSYSIAMLAVALGNSGLVALLCPTHLLLHIISPIVFLLIRFLWQRVAFPILSTLLVA